MHLVGNKDTGLGTDLSTAEEDLQKAEAERC